MHVGSSVLEDGTRSTSTALSFQCAWLPSYFAIAAPHVEPIPPELMSSSGTSSETTPQGAPPNPCSNVPALPPGENIDRNIAAAQSLRRQAWAESGRRGLQAAGSGGVLALNYFYLQVRLNGPWDYKQIDSAKYEVGGNFNFGATGAAMRIPEQVLLRGAGAAQIAAGNSSPSFGSPLWNSPYGDDPRDQAWIREGIAYYENCWKP